MTPKKPQNIVSKIKLVNYILNDRLGELAPLVAQYLEEDLGKVKRNYMPVTNAAAASLWYNVSSAASAAIASGFLKDLIEAGHLDPSMSYLAVDPGKVQRARENVLLIKQRKSMMLHKRKKRLLGSVMMEEKTLTESCSLMLRVNYTQD